MTPPRLYSQTLFVNVNRSSMRLAFTADCAQFLLVGCPQVSIYHYWRREQNCLCLSRLCSSKQIRQVDAILWNACNTKRKRKFTSMYAARQGTAQKRIDDTLGENIGTGALCVWQNHCVIVRFIVRHQIDMTLQLTDAPEDFCNHRHFQRLPVEVGWSRGDAHFHNHDRERTACTIPAEELLLQEIEERRISKHTGLRAAKAHHDRMNGCRIDRFWYQVFCCADAREIVAKGNQVTVQQMANCRNPFALAQLQLIGNLLQAGLIIYRCIQAPQGRLRSRRAVGGARIELLWSKILVFAQEN